MTTETLPIYTVLRHRAEKTVKYRTPQGKDVCLTREVYLRDNVACKCRICAKPECAIDSRILSENLKTYLVIDGFEALHYWEIFELPTIQGIIISLSTIYYVQQQAQNRIPYKRIRKCLEDPVQSCILFDNEFHRNCYQPPKFGEDMLDYTTRMNCTVSNWYQNHLGPDVSVLFITNNKQIAMASFTSGCVPHAQLGINVLSLSEFLDVYHPNLTSAKLLLSSLDASLKSTATQQTDQASTAIPMDTQVEADVLTSNALPKAPKPGDVFPQHLPESALHAGLRSGQFIRGILRVSRFRTATEATVTLTDASMIKHQPELKDALTSRSEVIIRGAQHRNRAIDGDLVVIRILPRDQWQPVSSDISATELNATELVDTCADGSGELNRASTVSSTKSSTLVPCGFVVGVMSRNWRDYVCAYQIEQSPSSSAMNVEPPLQETGWVLVTPWDRRIPRVRIHTSQATKLSQERFVVRIDSWDASSNYPHGHFVQSLGVIGNLETETQTLLIEHCLAIREFSDAQLNELATYGAQRPWRVDPTEVTRRRDLRPPELSGNPASEGTLIFSIDPPGCQDVDDALSVRLLKSFEASDGTGLHRRVQLGVHIADVTYFVPPGGFVDAEARRRSTSIYLADRRYDMLPGLLSGDICSLWSGVDRYAVSVIWEIDMDSFDVLDVWFGRTVIRSSYKMTYEAAQKIFDFRSAHLKQNGTAISAEQLLDKLGGMDALIETVPEFKGNNKTQTLPELSKLASSIDLLVNVARAIRTRRLAQGGLELDSVEVSVRFSDPETRSGKLEDLIPKEPIEMHGTIAELMIFANHWVARRCLEAYPERSCLRRHPPPRPEFFDELRQCAASRGFALDTESNRSLAASLMAADDPGDPEVKRVLLQLTTRAMTNALYFCTGADNLTQEQFAHYGLALNLYTHFTSPIRRYADMIVHRVLLTALGDARSAVTDNKPIIPPKTATTSVSLPVVMGTEDDLFSPEELSDVCRHMNEQHWAAQRVQRASMELFQALYFFDRPEDDPLRVVDGIICQMRGANGFVVFVPRYGIRGAICIKDPQGQIAWAKHAAMKSKPGSNQIDWMPSDSGFQVNRVQPAEARDCGILEVHHPDGSVQSYKLFDHVTVSIHVSESKAHGLGLRLKLLSGPRTLSGLQPQEQHTDEQRKKINANLIESVRSSEAHRNIGKHGLTDQTADGEEAPDNNQERLICELHDPTSIYHQFHKLMRANPHC